MQPLLGRGEIDSSSMGQHSNFDTLIVTIWKYLTNVKYKVKFLFVPSEPLKAIFTLSPRTVTYDGPMLLSRPMPDRATWRCDDYSGDKQRNVPMINERLPRPAPAPPTSRQH